MVALGLGGVAQEPVQIARDIIPCAQIALRRRDPGAQSLGIVFV